MPPIPILPTAYEAPPDIDRNLIPADQMEAFLHTVNLLAELGLYERHFQLAVFLYEYSQTAAWEISNDFARLEWSLWTTGGWQQMSGRDGALTIYHFGCAIEGLQNSLSGCPALHALVDHKTIRLARKVFNAAFPGYIRIRDVVAHVADFSGTLERKKQHAIKGPFKERLFSSTDPNGLTWLRGNMNGPTYAVSYEGKAFTYDVSLETAAKLRSVKTQIYSAFNKAITLKPTT
jgi:hypothetical protein